MAGGHKLFLHNRSGAPHELGREGRGRYRNGRDVARQSDVIITIVSNTPDVEQALFGPAGVAEGLTPGKIVVDMSSISPIATKEFARAHQRA